MNFERAHNKILIYIFIKPPDENFYSFPLPNNICAEFAMDIFTMIGKNANGKFSGFFAFIKK